MAINLSGVANDVKNALIDMEGAVVRSEVYFRNLENQEEVQLCRTPQVIKARSEANFRTFSVIERGEIKLPKGERLTQIMWNDVLPDAGILKYPGITHAAWEKPEELIKVFKRWREEGARIRLLVTQTPLNLDVYIKSFDYEASGGMGSYKYSIELIAFKELKVMTVQEADAARAKAKENSTNALNQRAAMKSRTGLYISQINNVWGIAQILLGQGSAWTEIANLPGMPSDPTDIILNVGIQSGIDLWG